MDREGGEEEDGLRFA